jgi:AraC-like DNA-binding protein
MLFIIGYMGIKQKPINPTFDLITAPNDESLLEEIPIAVQKKILDKMLVQFEEKKIYLNSQLTIMDVAQLVGTNRSYISGIINRQYNQNFCSFVNNYRLEELKAIIHNSPDSTNDILAESCGFGSVISLKRAIYATAGISITEWKYNELTIKKPGEEQK